MSKYITLNDVEVTDITVRVDLSDILENADEQQLVDALVAQDYDGGAFLENASEEALWEALGDKDVDDLIDLLDNKNDLERAARRFLDNLPTGELRKFVGDAYMPTLPPLVALTFIADAPTAPVHWVQEEGAQTPCGMILLDLHNIMEGRAKLRMFVGTQQDDTGWIDCADMPAAQRLARTLHAGRVALAEQRGKEAGA